MEITMLFRLLKDIFFSGKSTQTPGSSPPSTKFTELADTSDSARKVLNVGGNSKDIPIPVYYEGWDHLLLDIDPRGNPDIVCDARLLNELPPAQFNAIYCSHNLEHYFRHDVAKVLAGFHHVLSDDGFVDVRVPDMGELIKMVAEREIDIDDFLYNSPAGPIHVIDVIYGLGREIEDSGNDFYAHKTGFTEKSLTARLRKSGFETVFTSTSNLEVRAIAFKSGPTDFARELLELQPTST
jgi:hypothetical protein